MAEHSSTDPGGRSARDIEREVETERAHVARTIDALEEKMSVGNLVDQAMSAFAEHGGTAGRNFGATLRDNPMPAVLTGVGLIWMMMGNGSARRSSRDYYDYDDEFDDRYDPYTGRSTYGFAGDDEVWDEGGTGAMAGAGGTGTAAGPVTTGTTTSAGTGSTSTTGNGGLGQRARDSASAASHRVRSGASGLAESGSSAWHGATEATASAADRARAMARDARRGASDRARSMRYRSRQAGAEVRDGFEEMMEEQPLVMGALALALGAALGGALPRTRTEDEYLGEHADRVKQGVQDTVRNEAEKARATAGAVAAEARDMGEEARDRLTQEGSKLADRADKAAADAVTRLGETARDEAHKQNLGHPDRS